MSFLIGLSFLILLSTWTVALYFISKLFTSKEFLLLPIILMFMGDGILVGMWWYGLSEFVSDVRGFRLGIGFSFMAGSFGRSLYFMIKNKEVFK